MQVVRKLNAGAQTVRFYLGLMRMHRIRYLGQAKVKAKCFCLALVLLY